MKYLLLLLLFTVTACALSDDYVIAEPATCNSFHRITLDSDMCVIIHGRVGSIVRIGKEAYCEKSFTAECSAYMPTKKNDIIDVYVGNDATYEIVGVEECSCYL